MAEQIVFFRKNWADFERSYVTVTATENNDLAANILDRSNRTAWGTDASTDASNTTLVIDAVDVGTIDSILLLKHNFKSFTIKYWDEIALAWTAFSTPIAPTNNTAESNYYQFNSVQTSKFQIVILGTMVADEQKFLYQFIATEKIGQLTGWPVIKKPTLARNLTETKMLSGKSFILQSIGFHSTSLEVTNWSSDADLTIVEALYNSSEGFLYWPCGGDESQFRSVRQGYRMEDIYLVRCKNEYSPEFVEGLYKAGLKLGIELVEVIT